MGEARHFVSVAAVVVGEGGRVLVVRRRDNGEWQIPGGVLELAESIPAGLCREVEEETGVRVEPVRLTGVYKHLRLGSVALVFRARPVSGRPRPTEESSAVAWLPVDEAIGRMGETFAVRVRDALDGGELDGDRVAVRLHDGVRLLSP